jgi:Ala-tRNA(Pro) deacylase
VVRQIRPDDVPAAYTQESDMSESRLKDFLDEEHVKYVTIGHSPAFTAQEIAAMTHIPGKELAKTVVVKIDGELAMVVTTASEHVKLSHLKESLGADVVDLASEGEFKDSFPDCETGAMPPFGNLYGMNVFVSQALREDEQIAFNAGSHSELVRLPYTEFQRLVHPTPLAM